MRFAVFPLHLSKVLRLPRKSEARSYKVLHLSRKIISANLKIWCSKMQSLSGNQRPDLRTALMKMSLVLRLPRKLHLYRSSSNVPRLPTLLQMLQNLTFCSLLARCRIPCACHAKPTSEPSKVVRHWGAFNMLTWKCASRHNGAHFLNISTSKRVPRLMCFVHFDLEMCFAPQRRAIFHLGSGQMAPHPPLQRACFWILGSHKSLEKYNVSRLSYLFAHPHLLSSDSFSSLIFSLLVFSSLTFPTSAFPCVHIVGSLTSKLPSISGLDVSRFCTGSLMTNILRKCLQTSIWNPATQRNLKNHVVYV